MPNLKMSWTAKFAFLEFDYDQFLERSPASRYVFPLVAILAIGFGLFKLTNLFLKNPAWGIGSAFAFGIVGVLLLIMESGNVVAAFRTCGSMWRDGGLKRAWVVFVFVFAPAFMFIDATAYFIKDFK